MRDRLDATYNITRGDLVAQMETKRATVCRWNTTRFTKNKDRARERGGGGRGQKRVHRTVVNKAANNATRRVAPWAHC